MRLLRAISVLSILAAPLIAQARPVTSEDYLNFRFVGSPQLSPDGKLVAYTITRIDRGANRRMTSIWLIPVDGSAEPRQLTANHLSSSGPRWRPDGKALGFTGVRPVPGDSASTRAQFYLLDLAGGEPRRLTNLSNGASGCDWSPDGTLIACLSRLGPSDRKAPSSDVRHYTGRSYKFNDSGWFDDKKSHVWVVDPVTGRSAQITSGDLWNDSDPQWSPDGSRIAFVSNRTGKESDGDDDRDVWVVSVSGGEPLKISDHGHRSSSPRWSPDGKSLLFSAQTSETAPPSLWIAPSAGGAPSKLLFTGTQYYPGDPFWAEAGKAVWFGTGYHGESHYFRLDVATGRIVPMTKGPRAVTNLSFHQPSGTLVYLANDFTHLDEVYVARADGTAERRLTTTNDAYFTDLRMMPVERMTYKGAEGWDVDGFLVKPVGWEPGKTYPMILSIHGGPAGQYGVNWYHEFHVYSGKGWAVFFTNPRGSTGYGHQFARGIENQWGGNDYIDVMNGVDAVLAANPWIDRSKLGVTGGSYGGYLTNWIVGHTDRFKAAVTLRSVVNFISDEGTRDGSYGHRDDFGGDLFQKFDLYWDRSPLQYAKHVTTPILILHSDNDYRVPLEQGEQWFRALRWFGKTAEIVIFPRENHNLTRTGEPKHLVESMDWQVYWFQKYLEGKADAVPPDRR